MWSSPTFWTFLIIGLVVLFFLPTIIALIRSSEEMPLVLWLNALGITIPVFGWIAAMAVACFSSSRRPAKTPGPAYRPSVPAPRTYDPGRALGTPFEGVARAGFWADHSETTSSKR